MKRKLLVFTTATCAVSWACWLPILDSLAADPFRSPPGVLLLFFLGAYAPTLVGIALTYAYDRGAGLRALFRRAVPTRRTAGWAFTSLAAGPVLYAAALAVFAASGGSLGPTNYGLLPWLPIVFVVPLVFGPLAEEFGWRGFALPLLDPGSRVVASSVTLGALWALWHAPLFWAATGTAISGFPVDAPLVGLFFLAVIGSSFLYTWLFNATGGSVFAAVMLHLGMNASGTIVGMLFPELGGRLTLYVCYVAVVWAAVLAGWLAWRLRGAPAGVKTGLAAH